jgi:hypothetical protein
MKAAPFFTWKKWSNRERVLPHFKETFQHRERLEVLNSGGLLIQNGRYSHCVVQCDSTSRPWFAGSPFGKGEAILLLADKDMPSAARGAFVSFFMRSLEACAMVVKEPGIDTFSLGELRIDPSLSALATTDWFPADQIVNDIREPSLRLQLKLQFA